ncbi:hypothetical protein HPB48_014944 [Haemaphysalis longicornis]|uniref:Ubiquitin-like domain-containing protein n=1 Tax=Haemaphysalis longicornis TaxID=44386 RepID=A0A9J6FGA9_HAELO|nr:hypothetical protein HPB48_014944 [Haemaphysalis longicornis]
MAAHDMSTCLVIRAPHQKFGDQQVYCSLDWSVQQLKQHLSKVYPSKPKPEDQKLIYSGQLLDDEVPLKDVFRLMASSQPDLDITGGSVSPVPSASPVASPSSPASTDGLRHRGTSNVAIPNGQLPFAVGLPPGVSSPEQLMQQVALAQQLYAHYFAQYMQLLANLLIRVQSWSVCVMGCFPMCALSMHQAVPPVAPSAPAPASSSPPVAPAAAAAAAPPAPRAAPADNRGPRMNAQGGPLLDEEEEEAAQRDWLDWVYTVSRATVLLGIVYFYSSFGRFLVVTGIALLMYLYQGGWLLGPRRQQQQERGHDRNRAREANNEQQPQAAPVAGPREGPQQEGAGAAQLDGAGDQDGDAAVAPPPPPEPRVSPVAMVWTFVATFFTSLIPEQPPPVNAN